MGVTSRIVTNDVYSLISAEIGADLNAELSRVVSELESAIGEREKIAVETHTDAILGKLSDNEIEEKAFQVNIFTYRYVCINHIGKQLPIPFRKAKLV